MTLPVIYNLKKLSHKKKKKTKAKNKIFTMNQCFYYPSERSYILM